MEYSAETLRQVINKAEIALGEGDFNLSLQIIHNFVENIITNPICTSQVLASPALDALCLSIGRHHFISSTHLQEKAPGFVADKQVTIYLVSRLQRSGGHSRLILDFIRAQPHKYHLILSTEIGGPSDYEHYLSHFASSPNVSFVRAPGGNFASRLKWLQITLQAYRPVHVYLFNHHQDSVAVAALVPELKIQGSFCHHGDHHLCLGVCLDHLVHLDFHPMGFHYCRDQLGLDNYYLPLTFVDQSDANSSYCYRINNNGLKTATAARYNKIEHPYYVSYFDIIPDVLAATKGTHLHIGKLSPWGLRRLRSNLSRKGIAQDRFIYIEWTPSVWKTLVESNVDVYLASFPYGAALTLIEAMGAGIPVILHQHMYSRVLSCLELAYEEAFSWSNPLDLCKHLASLRPQTLLQESVYSRQRYIQYHRPELLQKYFADPQSIVADIPPLREDFKPKYDEWAAWVESQMSMSSIIKLILLRILRRFRLSILLLLNNKRKMFALTLK